MTDKTKECYEAFKVERDPFCLEPDLTEGIEEKWWKLGENLINEKAAMR